MTNRREGLEVVEVIRRLWYRRVTTMRTGWIFFVLMTACEAPAEDREAELINVYTRADQALIRTRPALTAGKYARMAANVYDYHRGSLPAFSHDFRTDSSVSASRFGGSGSLVLGTGDPHPENFGVLVAADDTLAIEPNDFDSADRLPYLWDLRRLLTGLVVAVHASNADDPAQLESALAARGELVRATVEAYAQTVQERAQGAPPLRVTTSLSNPVLEDLLSRSAGDLKGRDELDELTELDGERRHLKRGALAPDTPEETLSELPEVVLAALPATLERYRSSLNSPPPGEFFRVLDAARRFGQGVASWPRVRLLILVRGPSDSAADDVVLEARELIDSGTAGWTPPGVHYDSPAARILTTSRAAWARPDAAPLWGVSNLLGFSMQIRWESEGQKTFRARRLVGKLGTPAAIVDFGRKLGALQARVHCTPSANDESPARRLDALIRRDSEGFVNEQTQVALRYAARVVEDHRLFARALARLGPRLGVPVSPEDLPDPDLAALYGSPPAVSP